MEHVGATCEPGWQKGPLPPNTYYWGGVVPTDLGGSGFYFADFCGDHVRIVGGETGKDRLLQPDEVAWWNNCLELPPTGAKGRTE